MEHRSLTGPDKLCSFTVFSFLLFLFIIAITNGRLKQRQKMFMEIVFCLPEIEALCMHTSGQGKIVVLVTKYLYNDALGMSPVTTSVWSLLER